MMPIAIPSIEQRLSVYTPPAVASHEQSRHAAVATILRENNHDTEALFILRATSEDDPWSGHMAFPGGHRDPGDPSLRAAAERETLEEIGLDLNLHARFLGEIDAVRANPRGRDINILVTPFVYVLEWEDPVLTPNYEVADILWGSLADMYSRNTLTRGEFEVAGQVLEYPGFSVGDHVVWGLTLRMLDQFFRMLDPDWQVIYE
ncbi:MAG: CoA pyrophosphatase [Pseudomonadales bacterium]